MPGISLAIGKTLQGLFPQPGPIKFGKLLWVGSHQDDTYTDQGQTLVFVGNGGNDEITGNNGSDIIFGNAGIDRLYGLGGPDTLYGGDGIDTLEGGGGPDILDGGEGFDFASYVSSPIRVIVDLGLGTGQGSHAQGDQYISIEGAVGSAHDDELYGDQGNNTLQGLSGADLIDGRSGDDLIIGGRNSATEGDTMTGGFGDDTFYFTRFDSGGGGGEPLDLITDFETNPGDDDTMRFASSSTDFTFSGQSGGFLTRSGNEAWYEQVGGAAGDETLVHVRAVEDSDTLFYDIRLSGHLTLQGTDFEFL